MKGSITSLTILLTLSIWPAFHLFSQSVPTSPEALSGESWTEPEIALPSQLDTAKWNRSFLESDIKAWYINNFDESDGEGAGLPMNVLPWPVVDYGFGACGVYEYERENPHRIVGTFFLVGKHDYNEAEFKGDDQHRVFFNLLVITDTIDTLNYTHIDNLISSRNHPDYIGLGRIKTKLQQIDYVAFHRPDYTSYAFIGGKLFDLQEGQTVIIAPQKDGSVRYVQLHTPYLSMQEAAPYFDRYFERHELPEVLNVR